MNKLIKLAAISGILSLIFSLPDSILEVLRNAGELENFFSFVYILFAVLSTVFYLGFIYGFKLIGNKYQNRILSTVAYIQGISAVIFLGYSIISLNYPSEINTMVASIILILFGLTEIIFNIAVLKLKTQFGSLATWTGVLGIISGALILSVFLAFLGLFLAVLVYILGVIILFRAAKDQSVVPP